MASQFIFNSTKGLQRSQCRILVCTDRHSQGIKDKVFLPNSVFCCLTDDFLCNLNSLFRTVRYAILIQGKAHYQTAIFLYQRENLFHDFFFSIDRIDHSFPIINPKCCFHGSNIRRINLERQVDDCLKFISHLLQHGLFIDFRQPHIHIQYVNAPVLLSNAFSQNIINIRFAERFLERFFPGWIDSFSDQNRRIFKYHCMGIGTDHSMFLFCDQNRFQILCFFYYRPYILRCGSTAAACHTHSVFYKRYHIF